eukprot:37242_1
MSGKNVTRYRCLWTKHKTQKRKTWNDGVFVVTSSPSVKGILYSEDKQVLGSRFLGSNSNLENGQEIELDMQLVEIDCVIENPEQKGNEIPGTVVADTTQSVKPLNRPKVTALRRNRFKKPRTCQTAPPPSDTQRFNIPSYVPEPQMVSQRSDPEPSVDHRMHDLFGSAAESSVPTVTEGPPTGYTQMHDLHRPSGETSVGVTLPDESVSNGEWSAPPSGGRSANQILSLLGCRSGGMKDGRSHDLVMVNRDSSKSEFSPPRRPAISPTRRSPVSPERRIVYNDSMYPASVSGNICHPKPSAIPVPQPAVSTYLDSKLKFGEVDSENRNPNSSPSMSPKSDGTPKTATISRETSKMGEQSNFMTASMKLCDDTMDTGAHDSGIHEIPKPY